jgi:hypothetical protein
VVPAAATSRSTKAAKWRDETGPSSRLGDVASASVAMRWAALPKQRVRGCIEANAEFDCQPQALAPRVQNRKADATTEALFARCQCAQGRTIGTRTLIAHIIGADWKPYCDPSRPPPLLAHGLWTARRAPDTVGFLLAMSDVSTISRHVSASSMQTVTSRSFKQCGVPALEEQGYAARSPERSLGRTAVSFVHPARRSMREGSLLRPARCACSPSMGDWRQVDPSIINDNGVCRRRVNRKYYRKYIQVVL